MNLVTRSNHLFLKLAQTNWYPCSTSFEHCTGNLLIVRWRKMRLDPPNLNKRMKVPFKNPLEEGEQDEISRLHQMNNFKDESLRIYLKKLYHKAIDSAAAEIREADEEEQEHRENMEYLNKENKRLAAVREERIRKEVDERLEYVMLSKMRHNEKAQRLHEEALQALQDAEELVQSFIPADRIAAALEEAYDNPVDYNYAIDSKGFMYPGLKTKPTDIAPEFRPHLNDPDVAKIGAIDLSPLRQKHAEKAAN